MSLTATPVEEALQRGINYKIEGLYDEAIAQFQVFLAEQPDHPRARMELGLVYGFIGLFDESIAELERAVLLAPRCVEMRSHLAMTYCMLGMVEEARAEFERVLEQEPGNGDALQQLEYLT